MVLLSKHCQQRMQERHISKKELIACAGSGEWYRNIDRQWRLVLNDIVIGAKPFSRAIATVWRGSIGPTHVRTKPRQKTKKKYTDSKHLLYSRS